MVLKTLVRVHTEILAPGRMQTRMCNLELVADEYNKVLGDGLAVCVEENITRVATTREVVV